jgi:hypothetical protein
MVNIAQENPQEACLFLNRGVTGIPPREGELSTGDMRQIYIKEFTKLQDSGITTDKAPRGLNPFPLTSYRSHPYTPRS